MWMWIRWKHSHLQPAVAAVNQGHGERNAAPQLLRVPLVQRLVVSGEGLEHFPAIHRPLRLGHNLPRPLLVELVYDLAVVAHPRATERAEEREPNPPQAKEPERTNAADQRLRKSLLERPEAVGPWNFLDLYFVGLAGDAPSGEVVLVAVEVDLLLLLLLHGRVAHVVGVLFDEICDDVARGIFKEDLVVLLLIGVGVWGWF